MGLLCVSESLVVLVALVVVLECVVVGMVVVAVVAVVMVEMAVVALVVVVVVLAVVVSANQGHLVSTLQESGERHLCPGQSGRRQ